MPGRVTVTRRAHNAELLVQFQPLHPILFDCILLEKGFGLRGERRQIKQFNFMASIKKGTLAKPLQWWKHLKEYKKIFWKTERRLTKKDIRKRLDD